MRLDLRSARWTWFQSFGHLPARPDNPYHMYIERRDPQISMPSSVQEAVNARRDALADLLAVDPTPLAPLPRRVAAHLLALIGPATRVPGARVWEAAAFWDRPLASTRSLRRPARLT